MKAKHVYMVASIIMVVATIMTATIVPGDGTAAWKVILVWACSVFLFLVGAGLETPNANNAPIYWDDPNW